MPLRREVAHQLLPAPAAWLPCALDRRLASASVSSKAIIAILSKTRPIARIVLLPVRLFVRPIQKARVLASAPLSSTQPASFRPWRNAATMGANPFGDAALRN